MSFFVFVLIFDVLCVFLSSSVPENAFDIDEQTTPIFSMSIHAKELYEPGENQNTGEFLMP